jgi:alkylation response protein AidB-like acyl-CoA dehydrogenase
MELVLNDEQRLLKESAEKLVEQYGGPDAHRALRDTDSGFDRARQKAVADAGWISIMVPERDGGLGLGLYELALVLEQAGRGLMTEPIAAAAICAYAIGAGRAATGTAEILAGLVTGEKIIIPALQDPAAPEADSEKIIASHYHYGYELTGERACVPLVAAADAYLVDAATSDGSILIFVPGDLFGVDATTVRTVDGGSHGTLKLSEATIMADDRLVAGTKQGGMLAADLYDRLLICASAEMLGVMEQALDLAIAYMKTREQFGRPIGSFQALQHRAVNDHTAIELTRSLLYQVCSAYDSGHTNRSLAAAVNARASEAVLSVTKSVIQMHGAIGFTDEYDAGLYLRRAMTLAAQYGNASFQRNRYAALAEAEAMAAAEPAKRRRRPKRKKSIFADQKGF